MNKYAGVNAILYRGDDMFLSLVAKYQATVHALVKGKRTILFLLISLYGFNGTSGFACELLGHCFNQTVPASQIFSVFRYRELPDGWGVAFYMDKSAQLFKEPVSIKQSALAEFLTTYEAFKTPLMIAHVRLATVGNKLYQNTHPFVREFRGKQYIAAHNGSLTNFQTKLKLGALKPNGSTDSEHLFCYILGQIEKENVGIWDSTRFKWFHSMLQTANGLGQLNYLFTDGEYLFAYHCKTSSEDRLHYVIRKPPYGTVFFKGLNQNVDLSKIYPPSANGILFATKPLSNEQWVVVKHGQLIVVKEGVIIYSSEQ